jgi:hypothetical protein
MDARFRQPSRSRFAKYATATYSFNAFRKDDFRGLPFTSWAPETRATLLPSSNNNQRVHSWSSAVNTSGLNARFFNNAVLMIEHVFHKPLNPSKFDLSTTSYRRSTEFSKQK